MNRFWIIGFLSLLACGGSENMPLPAPTPLDLVRNETTDLSTLGDYVRAVRLETPSSAALLGMINKVAIDTTTGDILAADYRAAKAIFRFDAEGRFLRREGALGQGPGEYEALQGFEILPDGKLLVLGLAKFIVYDVDGSLHTERRVDLAANWAATIGSRLYVRAIGGNRKENAEVFELDDNLDRVAEFHRLDPRLEQIAFIPRDTLAVVGNRLFVSEHYDLRVTAYDSDGSPYRSWSFPNENHLLSDRFARARKMSRDDLFAFFDSLHRARSIFPAGDRLFLLEVHKAEGIMRPVLLDPETNRATVFTRLKLVHPEFSTDYLTMTKLVGAYPGGLIGTCDDEARFDTAREHHPNLDDIAHAESENPVLLFFAFAEDRLM